MNFKLAVFARLCVRCRETALEAGAPQVLADIYQSASAQPLQRFCDLMKHVSRAQTRANNAARTKARVLQEMDSLFRCARAAVRAVDRATVLPATLKGQPTDTDKRDAVEELLEAIAEHAGEAWADNLAQGEFGQKAAATIQAIDDYITAWNALQKAKAERASAYKPAWEAYLDFKRLVGSTLGKASRQYQRLRIRDAASGEDAGAGGGEGDVEGGAGEDAPVETKDEERALRASPPSPQEHASTAAPVIESAIPRAPRGPDRLRIARLCEELLDLSSRGCAPDRDPCSLIPASWRKRHGLRQRRPGLRRRLPSGLNGPVRGQREPAHALSCARW